MGWEIGGGAEEVKGDHLVTKLLENSSSSPSRGQPPLDLKIPSLERFFRSIFS